MFNKNTFLTYCKEYEEALIKNADHYYCIAKEKSLVSGRQFLDFCDECELEYQQADLGCVNPDSVQLIVKVKESLIDPIILRKIITTFFSKYFLISTFFSLS